MSSVIKRQQNYRKGHGQNRSGKWARNIATKKRDSKNGALQNRGKGQGENTRQKTEWTIYCIEHTSGKEEGKRDDHTVFPAIKQGGHEENTRQRTEWTINRTNRKRTGQEWT